MDEVLTNEIILPPEAFADTVKKRPAPSTDPQLQHLVDFGSTLEEVSTNFKARMDAFQRVDGTGDGSNKYYRLGSHIYTSAASCLDRIIANHSDMPHHDVNVLERRIAFRLKRPAANIPDVKSDFREYWNNGNVIADESPDANSTYSPE